MRKSTESRRNKTIQTISSTSVNAVILLECVAVFMARLVLYTPATHYLSGLSFVNFAGTSGTDPHRRGSAPDTFIAAMSVAVYPEGTFWTGTIGTAAAKFAASFILDVFVYLVRAVRTRAVSGTSAISAI